MTPNDGGVMPGMILTRFSRNYLPFLQEDLKTVQDVVDKFGDIVLHCKDGECKAISSLLSAASKYLAMLLSHMHLQVEGHCSVFDHQIELSLPDITKDQIRILLTLLLFGIIEASPVNYRHLEEVVKILHIDIFVFQNDEQNSGNNSGPYSQISNLGLPPIPQSLPYSSSPMGPTKIAEAVVGANGTEEFACSHCPEKFNSQKKLNLHCRVHFGKQGDLPARNGGPAGADNGAPNIMWGMGSGGKAEAWMMTRPPPEVLSMIKDIPSSIPDTPPPGPINDSLSVRKDLQDDDSIVAEDDKSDGECESSIFEPVVEINTGDSTTPKGKDPGTPNIQAPIILDGTPLLANKDLLKNMNSANSLIGLPIISSAMPMLPPALVSALLAASAASSGAATPQSSGAGNKRPLDMLTSSTPGGTPTASMIPLPFPPGVPGAAPAGVLNPLLGAPPISFLIGPNGEAAGIIGPAVPPPAAGLALEPLPLSNLIAQPPPGPPAKKMNVNGTPVPVIPPPPTVVSVSPTLAGSLNPEVSSSSNNSSILTPAASTAASGVVVSTPTSIGGSKPPTAVLIGDESKAKDKAKMASLSPPPITPETGRSSTRSKTAKAARLAAEAAQLAAIAAKQKQEQSAKERAEMAAAKRKYEKENPRSNDKSRNNSGDFCKTCQIYNCNCRPFDCEVCRRRFKQKTHLQEHIKCHFDRYYYECAECKKQFKRNSVYRKHLKLHSGHKRFKCDYCPRQFHHRFLMVSHLSRIHGVTVETSPNVTPTQAAAANHASDPKPDDTPTTTVPAAAAEKTDESGSTEVANKCKDCDKVFRNESAFKNHLKMHNKNFFCEGCGKGFSQEKAFLSHLQYCT